MLNLETLQQFARSGQTNLDNVLREYCQHLFLSYLYQERGSERLLFKGGTALRIIFKSPRFSEDLDFDGIGISPAEIDQLFMNALANIEKTGIQVQIHEAKKTSGGYLGIAVFHIHGREVPIQIEISLRDDATRTGGMSAIIQSGYLPTYTIVHVPADQLVEGKLNALLERHKPRDYYDFYFLLSGDFPTVRDSTRLKKILVLLQKSSINFRNELRRLLPMSHAMLLKDFKKALEQKIELFLP